MLLVSVSYMAYNKIRVTLIVSPVVVQVVRPHWDMVETVLTSDLYLPVFVPRDQSISDVCIHVF